MPNPSPEHLYKFLTPDGALAVLAAGRLRFSAPDRFGERFALGYQSELGFDASSLLDATIKLASAMIFAPEEPKGESPLINAIQRWREEGRFDTPEEANLVLRELLGKMVEYRVNQLQASMSEWQRYVRNARFCCFCAKPDGLGAWETYAANHEGVALRFAQPGDGPCAGARPVMYQTERPEFSSLREQLGAILHNRKDKVMERFADHHFIKSDHRKTDEEWRSYRVARQPVGVDNQDPTAWLEEVAFAPEQLSGVIFGIACSEDTKRVVIELQKQRYPQAKLLQAVRSKSDFRLDIERLKI